MPLLNAAHFAAHDEGKQNKEHKQQHIMSRFGLNPGRQPTDPRSVSNNHHPAGTESPRAGCCPVRVEAKRKDKNVEDNAWHSMTCLHKPVSWRCLAHVAL